MKRLVLVVMIALPAVLYFSRNRLLQCGASSGRTAFMSVGEFFGADIDGYAPDGNTPLISAASAGQVDVVNRLIAAGADVNKRSQKTGTTALMAAATIGNMPTIDALLGAGASIGTRDSQDKTAYWYAWWNHHSEVAEKVHHVRQVEIEVHGCMIKYQITD